MASKNYATMPIKQQLSSTRDHILFTSVSSNESATNTSSDIVDAAPLRIQSIPLLSEDYSNQPEATGENLLAKKTPTQSSRLSHYENTTMRKRSVSLPIDQFTKNTGQIDGRYLPKDSQNYSNPNLSSYLESDDECRKYGLTETDLVANSQPRPDSENQNNDQEAGKIEEATARPVSTLQRNINTKNHKLQENVRKFGNTTRRMRSVSDSDHSEPVSLPIDALSKSTGQIDGRNSPENSKNYSNPNLSSSLESDDECRKYGLTETDLVVNSQPRPDSQNQNKGQEVIQIERVNQGTAGPVSTPSKNVYTKNHTTQKSVRKFENTTRRMRSVSESDHSEPVSLPIDAFTKRTGQIDGRNSPENSKNYSNPNLSSSLESDDECRMDLLTGTDLVANRRLSPDSENQNNDQEDGQIEENNQGTVQENESSGCCSGIYKSVCDFLHPVKLYFCDHHAFSKLDFLLTVVSIGIFLFDVASDLTLAATYYNKIEDNEIYRVYFGLTLSFVIIPSVITQFISYFLALKEIRWNCISKEHLVIIVIHFFQLSGIFRYFRVIYYGLKIRSIECGKKKGDIDVLMYNVSTLKVEYELEVGLTIVNCQIESFMESAPQLVLQIYIVLMTKQFPLITVISLTASLLALSITMVSNQRFNQVLDNKTQLSIPASIVIFCWRACTILSRVVVFGLFLTVQPYVFLACVILHWIVATVLLGKQNTGKWISFKMLVFGITYGIVYIFCFINYCEENDEIVISSRLKMFVFYLVVVIENVVFSCWWYFTQLHNHTGLPFGNLSSTSSNETSTGLHFGNLSSTSSNETIVEKELFPTESAGIIFGAVHGVFWLGMFSMLVYYKALHPKRSSPTCCCFPPKTLVVENSGTTPVSAPASAPATLIPELVL